MALVLWDKWTLKQISSPAGSILPDTPMVFLKENFKNVIAVILLPAHPASFAHKFLFQRVPASPGMQ